jgi:uncharacterized protein with HEPN domain
MTPRSPQAFLWDSREAARSVLRFTKGKHFDDYLSDELLRLAIERQLITVGEALRAALELDSSLSSRFPDASKIIALRNRIVHGYFTISNEIVWEVVHKELIGHVTTIDRLLPDDPVNPLTSP